MEVNITDQLTNEEVNQLDPYVFMGVVGKQVIHPGGRYSTEELFRRADFHPSQHVLDVGCGVGTSAIEIVRSYNCRVTEVDISPIMLDRAKANVRSSDNVCGSSSSG